MPYSPRYLINLAARGRPMPTDQPEDHLFRALQSLSPMDVAQALAMGAQPMARNGRGQTAPEVVLDAARRRPDLARAGACLAELARQGRGLLGPDARARQALAQAGALLAHAGGRQIEWFAAWERLVSGTRPWLEPDGTGRSALDEWRATARPDLLQLLDRRFPAPAARPGPGPR